MEKMWKAIKEFFDVVNPKRPIKVDKERLKSKEDLKEYVDKCSEFICEVPKARALQIPDLDKCAKLGPFQSVYTCKRRKRNFNTYVEDLHVTLQECER